MGVHVQQSGDGDSLGLFVTKIKPGGPADLGGTLRLYLFGGWPTSAFVLQLLIWRGI